MRPEGIPIQEVKRLLKGCPEPTKLYLLLMLNTGMQQKDISNLRPSEVDWKAGRIIRRRGKLKRFESAPEVSYKLWPETFRLLKRLRADSKDRVLLTAKGGPLVVDALKEGKRSKYDTIRSAYVRWLDKLELKGKNRHPLKLLRKTSSSLLEDTKEYASVVNLFLGNTPRSIKDRHYVAPPQTVIDSAVKWLGKQYGVTK